MFICKMKKATSKMYRICTSRYVCLILCSLICVLLFANLNDLLERYQIKSLFICVNMSNISDQKDWKGQSQGSCVQQKGEHNIEGAHGSNAQQNKNDFYDQETFKGNIENDDRKWIQEMSYVYERAPYKNPDKQSFVKQNDTVGKCNNFHSSFKENLQKVLNYSFNVPKKYLELLYLDNSGIINLTRKAVGSPYPILASATSSNHFNEIQVLIKDYHEKLLFLYRNMKLIVYDLGLDENQLNQMKKYCNCEVRQFPFQSFPNHIRNLVGYSWKPLIIQLLLKEYDFVMWADASVRFNGNPLNKLIDGAKKIGVQMLPGSGSIAVRTNPRTFEALGEQVCMFDYPELQATWMTFARTEFTLKAVMKPWISCALQYGCMDFEDSKKYLKCSTGANQRPGSCHRFDQSVIGIILTRLFNHKLHLCQFDVKRIGSIRRKEKLNYFPE